MKINKLLTKIFVTSAIATTLFFSGCSMGLEADPGEFANNSIKDISGLMNRSAVEKMMFMGGSVLYSPKNTVSNQLQKGVKIAYRQGNVTVIDPGDGNLVYYNDQVDSVFGYLTVNDISLESITVEAFTYDSTGYGDRAYSTGVFKINLGEKVDIDRDGFPDLSYTRPMAGKKGYNTDRWLNFICDASVAKKSMMFSVIPMQYSRSVYPGGIIGINTNGNYIVSKYDVGTGSRALVSNISYGDYIIDTQSNTVGRYVGEGINAKGARAVNDSELKVEESYSSNSSVEDFYFTASVFINNYSITDLIEALPSEFVTTDYLSNTLAQNVEYLNNMVRQPDFLEKILRANQEKSPDIVQETMNELAGQPLANELDYFLVSRHVLALLYPDLCPDIDLSSKSLCVIFPWLYVDMGELTNQQEIEEAVARSVTDTLRDSDSDESRAKRKEINARLEKYAEEAKQAHAGEVGIYTDEYIEYEIKRDVLLKRFDELYSYNFLPFLASLTSVQFLTDIVQQTNGTLSLGIGGHISFANMNPDICIKLGLLVRLELEDRLNLSISSTSLFAGEPPTKKDVEDCYNDFKNKYGEMQRYEEKQLEYFRNFNEHEFKDKMGIDNWYFKWTKQNEKIEKNNVIKPSDTALSIHKSVRPISILPIVVTFDSAFDILLKTKAIVEFQDCFAGGVFLFVGEEGHKLEWGFRKKFLGIPLVWTFYANETHYSLTDVDYAGYAGVKKIDQSGVRVGGGLQLVLAPVVEFRVGVGIGVDLGLVEGDATLGAAVDIYAPIGLYLGLTTDLNLNPKFVVESTMDIGMALNVDFQFYLDPPIIGEKRWKYDIKSLPLIDFNVFDVRFENFERVTNTNEKIKQRDALYEKQTKLFEEQREINDTIALYNIWMTHPKSMPARYNYDTLKALIAKLENKLNTINNELVEISEQLKEYY